VLVSGVVKREIWGAVANDRVGERFAVLGCVGFGNGLPEGSWGGLWLTHRRYSCWNQQQIVIHLLSSSAMLSNVSLRQTVSASSAQRLNRGRGGDLMRRLVHSASQFDLVVLL